MIQLSSGTRLGRYQIRSRLGAGGMAEVYLADDLELGRPVALKLLPADSRTDPQARTLSEPKRMEVFEGGHMPAIEQLMSATSG